MKKKLTKRMEKLESLRSKMKAKYGASDTLVIELDKEIAEAQAMIAILKSKSMLYVGQQDSGIRQH
jgi:uncharacterized protein YbaP (TraB family)